MKHSLTLLLLLTWLTAGAQTKKDTTKQLLHFEIAKDRPYAAMTFDNMRRYSIHDSLKGEVAYKLSDTSKWVVLDTQATINTLIKLLNFKHQYSNK